MKLAVFLCVMAYHVACNAQRRLPAKESGSSQGKFLGDGLDLTQLMPVALSLSLSGGVHSGKSHKRAHKRHEDGHEHAEHEDEELLEIEDEDDKTGLDTQKNKKKKGRFL